MRKTHSHTHTQTKHQHLVSTISDSTFRFLLPVSLRFTFPKMNRNGGAHMNCARVWEQTNIQLFQIKSTNRCRTWTFHSPFRFSSFTLNVVSSHTKSHRLTWEKHEHLHGSPMHSAHTHSDTLTQCLAFYRRSERKEKSKPEKIGIKRERKNPNRAKNEFSIK